MWAMCFDIAFHITFLQPSKEWVQHRGREQEGEGEGGEHRVHPYTMMRIRIKVTKVTRR